MKMQTSYLAEASPGTKGLRKDCQEEAGQPNRDEIQMKTKVSVVRVRPTGPTFSATHAPEHVVEAMCDVVGVTAASRVLEPSAGSGGMRDVINRRGCEVVSVELNKALFAKLDDGKSINCDFLRLSPKSTGLFSHVMMCPPRNSDQHIEHALNFLTEDGKLAALVQEQNITQNLWNYEGLSDRFEWGSNFLPCGVVYHGVH